ncbi:Predicted dithiol-disulfide oxidoreductase, DUF899 family [Streptomyces sp. 3213]|uniref:DUF899 family protein n=1 Tax=Streptomyces sp. 3213.3 TaxID=1855348 RepID=UPI00089C6CA8|nr:DUF899 family protein [Streptomyces sp. 3213.3]SEC25471.1 Predicted dithiol-disulfide oxidoreductase, DUF899 family [Streptomyces sp. 3213] [Streptomyces sp. 3213.3]
MNSTYRAQVVTPAEWEAARLRLLAREQELTRARDALAARHRRMPWLKADQEYAFDGPNSAARLLDLFEGSRQLLLSRAFFEPGVDGRPTTPASAARCRPARSPISRISTPAFASRAPQPDIEQMAALMGWAMPWYTITDSFDADFGLAERYGTNAFFRDGDTIYRTYFANDREHEPIGAISGCLDFTALGRQEDWEDSPDGYPQVPRYSWLKRHDEYGPTGQAAITESAHHANHD